MDRSQEFDAIEVLTRAGAERDHACALLDADIEGFDAQLVSDVLRVAGRVGATLDTRRALVELCALVRALDAAEGGRIDLVELRAGIALHAARTDGFAQFHDARVLLRTLVEVLEAGRAEEDSRATRSQVSMLHRELRGWLLEQLTGDPAGTITSLDADGRGRPAAGERIVDPRAPWLVRDSRDAAHADALVHELLHGARNHPVTGILGAAWMRGWSAVPLPGEQLGEEPLDLELLAVALELLEPVPTALVQVDRRRAPRWLLEGQVLRIGDGLRRSWRLPLGIEGLQLAATERRGWTVLTTPDLQFACIEAAGHRALLGPTEFVVAACGMPPLEVVARFREHVESLAVEGEPPEDLLEVATRFGRLRRRSR